MNQWAIKTNDCSRRVLHIGPSNQEEYSACCVIDSFALADGTKLLASKTHRSFTLEIRAIDEFSSLETKREEKAAPMCRWAHFFMLRWRSQHTILGLQPGISHDVADRFWVWPDWHYPQRGEREYIERKGDHSQKWQITTNQSMCLWRRVRWLMTKAATDFDLGDKLKLTANWDGEWRCKTLW